MKILQINTVYRLGSTGKIVDELTNFCLSHNDKVLVLYGRNKIKNVPSYVVKVSSEIEAKVHSVMSRMTGLDFGFSPIATKLAINYIKSFKPDVVHLHCLNGHFINVFKLINYLKKEKIPTVLTLHAEIMHTAGCEHAYDCVKWIEGCHDCAMIHGKITKYFRDDARYAYFKMKKAFDGFNDLMVVSVSDWLTNRAKQSSIFRDSNAEFITIENGLDLKSFYPIPLKENPLQDRFDVSKPIILHVTPNFLHPLKGGKYVIELARLHPEWNFIIVGYNGEGIFSENVRVISHTANKEELSWYYNIASITLLTSKRETFSMVCAESLACGTPIVGFEAGGPESVFIGDYAIFVEYGNLEALSSAIMQMLSSNKEIETSLIHGRFKSERMSSLYRNCYNKIAE